LKQKPFKNVEKCKDKMLKVRIIEMIIHSASFEVNSLST
jgi:hypothetical protein